MNSFLSALCLVFSLSCQSPGVYQDAGQSAGGGGGGGGAVAWAGAGPGQQAGGKDFHQLSLSNEHGTLMLVLRGEDKTTAILDGELLPKERVVRDGDHLKVTDADGETMFDIRVLPGNRGLAFPYDSSVLTSNGVMVSAFPGLLHASAEESRKPRKMIGVTTVPLDPALGAQLGCKPDEAIVVSEVFPDMPAKKAGLQAYDVVLKIDGEAPVTSDSLREVIRGKEAGQELTLSIVRAGKPLELKVGIEEVSGEKLAAASPGLLEHWEALAGAAAGEDGDTDAGDMASHYGVVYRALQADSEELAAAQEKLEAARDELDTQLDQLSEEIDQVASDSDRKSMEGAQESLRSALARVADATAMLKAQQEQSQGGASFLSGSDGTRSLLLPRSFSVGGGEAGDTAALKKMEERFAQVEDRMKRLEEMLQRLVDASGKPAAAPSSDGQR